MYIKLYEKLKRISMAIASKYIYNGSSVTINANFYDDDDTPLTPTAVQYRVRCKTSDQTLRDFTSITPSSSVNIVLDSTDTELQTSTNFSEMKSVDVSAFFSDGQSLIESYDIVVRNVLL